MEIYFCGSIRGGRDDQKLYAELISFMQKHADVLTAHVGEKHFVTDQNNTSRQIYERDMDWMDQADFVVAEVSTPSLGVGFEIARAISLDKKILCLSHTDKHDSLSAIISGCPDVRIVVYSDINEARSAIIDFLAF